MSIKYDLTAIEALELFLDGKECGMPESVLTKYENEIGVKINIAVREFAAKYFHMIPNSGKTRIGDFHLIHVGNDLRIDDLLVIGYDDDSRYAVQTSDEDDPLICFGRVYGENIEWRVTELRLKDFLIKVTAEGLSQYCEAAFSDTPTDIAQILKKFGADINLIECKGGWGFSICFNDERQELAVILHGDGELKNAAVYVKTSNELERAPFGGNTNDELKQFFEDEFYINSINCNYEYALMINTERIKRTKESGAPATQRAELERLSARCLWTLGRYDEAQKLLNSAAAAFTNSLINTYTALSNMLGERGETVKSNEAFNAVLTLSELSGNYDNLGMLYQTQGQKLDKDMATIDKAIELYEKAILCFRRMPKPNKHDIARTQQLKGEAVRRKKELEK